MGNSESSTNTSNRKVFKIVRKEKHSGWFRCHLDDYVTYSNGNYKHIDFDDAFSRNGSISVLGFLSGAHLTMVNTDEGYHLSIDLNSTINYSSGHEFVLYSNFSGIHNVRSEVYSLSENRFLEANRELVEEIVKNREMYANVAEYNRWLAQVESWTSYDLPPR